MHTALRPRLLLLPAMALLLLSACASLHESTAALPWQDQWGDRGRQVLARDHAMCEALVEQRRSLLSSCLQARGWVVGS